jgi:hypothetical protein
MVILRAALRATKVYGPLVVTRGTVVTAAAALLVGAGAGGALAVVAAVHPVRVVLIAVGLGLVVGGESLIIGPCGTRGCRRAPARSGIATTHC